MRVAISALVLLLLSSCSNSSSSGLSFQLEQLSSPEQLAQLSRVSSIPGGTVLSRSAEDVLIGIAYGECSGAPAHVEAVHLDNGIALVAISPSQPAGGPQSACADVGRNVGLRLAIPTTTTLNGVEVRYKN